MSRAGQFTSDESVAHVRRFNRFYTRQIGILDRGFLETAFSLTEVRVLYEVAHREDPQASHLTRELGLDAGYLSRILRRFDRDGLLEREPSAGDARRAILRLTKKGRVAVARIEARQQTAVADMLRPLSDGERRRMAQAMDSIERLLAPSPVADAPYRLRPHRPGDMGWVVQRHGALYASEYGWDERFEALVARIAADFIDHFDPERERCWIAERDGVNLGSIFCVRKSKTAARLRLLLVEPDARGLGIGKRLVGECIAFARQAGYRKMTLWTQDVLHAARHIYQAAGFRLAGQERHHSFGHDLVAQTWDLEL